MASRLNRDATRSRRLSDNTWNHFERSPYAVPQDPSGDADAPHGRWQIWIDTGGTFTDCIATDPAGVVHRAKVLSHSALRGRIGRRIDDRRLVIAADWTALSELICGLQFHVLGEQSQGIDVVGYDPTTAAWNWPSRFPARRCPAPPLRFVRWTKRRCWPLGSSRARCPGSAFRHYRCALAAHAEPMRCWSAKARRPRYS